MAETTTEPPPTLAEEVAVAIAELLGVDPSTIDPAVVEDVLKGNSSTLIGLIDTTGITVTAEDVTVLANTTRAIPTGVIEDLMELVTQTETAEVLEEIAGVNATELLDSGIVGDLLDGNATSLIALVTNNNITLTPEDIQVLANSTSISLSVIVELEEFVTATEAPSTTAEAVAEAVADLLNVDPSTVDPELVAEVLAGNSSGLVDLIEITGATITLETVAAFANATSAIPSPVIEDLSELATENEAADVLAEILGVNATILIESGIADDLLDGNATTLIDLLNQSNDTLTLEDVQVLANSTSIPEPVIDELMELASATPSSLIPEVTEAIAELLGVDPTTIDPDIIAEILNAEL